VTSRLSRVLFWVAAAAAGVVSVPIAAVLGVLARLALERYRASTLYDPYWAALLCRHKPDE
jgi:hypothetical protein